MTTEQLVRAIYNTRFRYHSEKELQHGIGLLLEGLKVSWRPEVILSPGNRIDFIVEPGIGIEVKTEDSTGGISLAAVTRQLFRYTEFAEIKELILVTTRAKHREQPEEMNGKPIYVVYLIHSVL